MTLVKRDKKLKTRVSRKKSLLKIKTTMTANLYIIKAFDFLLYFIDFIYFIINIVSINLLSIIKNKKKPSMPQFRGNYKLRAEKYGMFWNNYKHCKRFKPVSANGT